MAVRKGDVAKETVTNTILSAFEGAFIVDKKIYVDVKDGAGETVQIAITLTAPKNPVTRVDSGTPAATGKVAAWEAPKLTTELSPEDKAKVQELMRRLSN